MDCDICKPPLGEKNANPREIRAHQSDRQRLEKAGPIYREVFGCEPKGPERDLSAAWLDRVNSVPNARLRGVHLRLPGYSDDGPTLEIFSYDQVIERGLPRANECGFGHIAFAVENVDEALVAVIAAGGGTVGEIATGRVKGAGLIRLVYARDPEGNIVELQKWS